MHNIAFIRNVNFFEFLRVLWDENLEKNEKKKFNRKITKKNDEKSQKVPETKPKDDSVIVFISKISLRLFVFLLVFIDLNFNHDRR